MAGHFSIGCRVSECLAHILPVSVPRSVWYARREFMRRILKELV
jgi:hypothetical protein